MFIPTVFRKDILDDVFNTSLSTDFIMKGTNLMNTDIKELKNNYELDIELPGFKKEDITVEIKNGYLIISAAHSEDNNEKNKEGKYVRKERYSGHCSRTFYIGEHLNEKDVSAKFKNGILKLYIPKKKMEEKEDEIKHITIEEL